MPEYKVYYTYRDGRRNITQNRNFMAIDETHLRTVVIDFARTVLKKFIKIIYTKEL